MDEKEKSPVGDRTLEENRDVCLHVYNGKYTTKTPACQLPISPEKLCSQERIAILVNNYGWTLERVIEYLVREENVFASVDKDTAEKWIAAAYQVARVAPDAAAIEMLIEDCIRHLDNAILCARSPNLLDVLRAHVLTGRKSHSLLVSPGNRELAILAGCSRDSVRHCNRELEKRGLIHCVIAYSRKETPQFAATWKIETQVILSLPVCETVSQSLPLNTIVAGYEKFPGTALDLFVWKGRGKSAGKIVRFLSKSRACYSVAEIAKFSGISPATAYRKLPILEKDELVAQVGKLWTANNVTREKRQRLEKKLAVTGAIAAMAKQYREKSKKWPQKSKDIATRRDAVRSILTNADRVAIREKSTQLAG